MWAVADQTVVCLCMWAAAGRTVVCLKNHLAVKLEFADINYVLRAVNANLWQMPHERGSDETYGRM